MILPDKEQFDYKECEISGDKCWLITPKRVDIKWTDENSRFRSCIVRQSDNFVVSQGFRKFTNFGEQPEFEPWDESWKFEARHKLDGSLLIVSKYKGTIIIRTRGTIDARQMANGSEIEEYFVKKHDKFFSCLNGPIQNGIKTFLFEWSTPSNIIVLREHEFPTFTLVGVVYNDNAEYLSQEDLDVVGRIYDLNRPKKYEYDSVFQCIVDVKAWKGKEGVVLYSPDGQTLKKIKADEYLELHRLATGMTSLGQVLDVFMASPKFICYNDFYKYVETTLDYEIVEKCKDHIQKICEAYVMFCLTKMLLKESVDEFEKMYPDLTRKEKAEWIIDSCPVSWERAYAFLCLDKREPNDKLVRTAIEDCLKVNEQLKKEILENEIRKN